eukprot:GHVS01088950.1.p1 GENE.GHVS01088950.1~~GHVS01088950.1.p1  ORF type:complete len:343 (+),score=63.60 GHVS01088950.1:134-1162(+)
MMTARAYQLTCFTFALFVLFPSLLAVVAQEDDALLLSNPISDLRETLSSLLLPSSSSSPSIISSLSASTTPFVEQLTSNLRSPDGAFRGASAVLRGGGRKRTQKQQPAPRAACHAGQTYTITSEADMAAVAAAGEEECLYRVGLAPNKPPLGIYFGKVLKTFNSDKFNDKVEEIWSGKLAFKSQCRREDSEFYMVMNFVANDFNMPALMYVGKLIDSVSVDDFDDGGNHLFVDYTPDMRLVCPLDEQNDKNFNMGIVNDVFGISALIDVVRYVGDTADGGHIMLGKTFARNPLNFPDDGDRAIAFWYVVNYDDAAFPPLPAQLGPIVLYTHIYAHIIVSAQI